MNKMTLASVHKGRSVKPDRILAFGTEGIGKSTFGASSPKPIFIAKEDGIKHLDVESFPEPTTFDDIIEAVTTLRTEKHDRETLVLDTVDWIEPLVFGKVIGSNREWKTIEDPGYGKGYTLALDYWRILLADLDRLRAEKGMQIILLGHAQTKPFNNPAGPDYARFELAMNPRGAALLKQWVDTVLFCIYEEAITKEKGEMRAKAKGTGKRVMHTERHVAWDAKNRYNLPAVLPLSYEDYAEARDSNTPELLATRLADAIKELEPTKELKKQIINFAGSDPVKLALSLSRVRAMIQEKESA